MIKAIKTCATVKTKTNVHHIHQQRLYASALSHAQGKPQITDKSRESLRRENLFWKHENKMRRYNAHHPW